MINDLQVLYQVCVLIAEVPRACVVYSHEGRSWYSAHRGILWIASTAKQPLSCEITATEEFYRKYFSGLFWELYLACFIDWFQPGLYDCVTSTLRSLLTWKLLKLKVKIICCIVMLAFILLSVDVVVIIVSSVTLCKLSYTCCILSVIYYCSYIISSAQLVCLCLLIVVTVCMFVCMSR